MGVTRSCPKFLGTRIISGTGKATDFKLYQYIQRVHPNKSPLKYLEKRECGRIQGLPKFFGYPLLTQGRESYGFQTWPVHSEGPSEQKPIKIFGEKGAWAYPRTAQFFSGIPYYPRNRKSYGFQIWPVHSEGPSE